MPANKTNNKRKIIYSLLVVCICLSIANIIAAAVKGGKRVLFVAEKVAALNVVKERLNRIGLGDMCLALHSNKARKAAVLEDIGRTLALEKPLVRDAEQVSAPAIAAELMKVGDV